MGWLSAQVLDASILSTDGWPYASSTPVDADDPGRFHALFGRDSLITSLAVMPAQPQAARATLRVLAELQGQREDPPTDQEPGKIVHEYRPHAGRRFAQMGWPVRDGQLRYYGSADGTSWFLVVLAALGDRSLADRLSESWRAAAGWLERALERGGGLVRYGPRLSAGGLTQQGWRDTSDPRAAYGGGILHPDGRIPEPPLADADTQAAAVAALRAAARLSGESRWQSLAAETVERIAAAFTPDTMAVSGNGDRVAGAGSQLGWLLWADALPTSQRSDYAERLCQPDVLTDFGVRTLSAEQPQFAPESYHRGAVWPFESWLAWGGLRAVGRAADGCVAAAVRRGDASHGRAQSRDWVDARTRALPSPAARSRSSTRWTVAQAICRRTVQAGPRLRNVKRDGSLTRRRSPLRVRRSRCTDRRRRSRKS